MCDYRHRSGQELWKHFLKTHMVGDDLRNRFTNELLEQERRKKRYSLTWAEIFDIAEELIHNDLHGVTE